MSKQHRNPNGWNTMLVFALVFSVTCTVLVALASLGTDSYYLGILAVLAGVVGVVWHSLSLLADQQQRKRYSAWRCGSIPQPQEVIKKTGQFTIRTLLVLTVGTSLILASLRTHNMTHLVVLLLPIVVCGLIGACEMPFPRARCGPLRGRAMNGALCGAVGGLFAAGLTICAGVLGDSLDLLSLRSAYLAAWWFYWGGFAGAVLGLLVSSGDYYRAPAPRTAKLQLPANLTAVETENDFTAPVFEPQR